jgi:NAD+ synthase
MPLPVIRPQAGEKDAWLKINPALVADWLVAFLKEECVHKRGIGQAIIGLSGGVDSAVSAALAARAFGPENVHCFMLPYKISSSASLEHAHLMLDKLGMPGRKIDITDMVDGYLDQEPGADATRIGNVCARCRANILFDQSAKLKGLPIGTGNKTERLFGYFTWHADDSPPINPLGDLYKTQVWDLAEELGIPDEIVHKAPTADLVKGQTDEGDFGISYLKADQILARHLSGYTSDAIIRDGFTLSELEIVLRRLAGSHWKRHLPTVAMLSDTAINEYYLRPVDYRGAKR